MLILQIPPRSVQFREPASFPATVRIHVELSPKAVFGVAPLNSQLPIVQLGQQVKLTAHEFYGGIRHSQQGQLEKLRLETTLFHRQIEIDGTTATLRFECSSERYFIESVSLAEVHLPAFLTAIVKAPVTATAMYGTVGTAYFDVKFSGSVELDLFADTAEYIALRTKEYFAKLDRLPDGSERIFAAHRYLQQARSLRMASAYPSQFLGERLLNLYKALESIFSSRQVDQIRKSMSLIGIPHDVAEFLCAVVFVRDQLDVGHMALHALDASQYGLVHRFADRAEDAVTWLLFRVVDAVIDGKFVVQCSSPSNRNKLFNELKKRDAVSVKPYEGFSPGVRPNTG